MRQIKIIDALQRDALWDEFLAYKINSVKLRKAQREDLSEYILQREYRELVERLLVSPCLGVPEMKVINKSGTTKKRIVFTFSREENYLLKMIAWLLHNYETIFSDNLYSFRSNTGVKKAIVKVSKTIDLANVYSYKVDISDYFNSVEVEPVLALVKEKLPEETWLYLLLENMLKNPYVMKDGTRHKVKKGIMAGVPVAGFLANLYLAEMDHYFEKRNVLYLRYSDDIIVFAKTEKEILSYETIIKSFLEKKNLQVNQKKEIRTLPGEKIEFLGFYFSAEEIDLSDVALRKIKKKMRRKARALYRWKMKKQVANEKVAGVYLRFLHQKFYSNPVRGEITWCRWYFPVITVDKRLKEIDAYAVSCIRYLYTGKHGKKNYNLRYEDIKEMGYKSLVHEYWSDTPLYLNHQT